MLAPKKMKFRKKHRGRIWGEAQSGNYLAFGEYGLMAVEGGHITSRQIEAGRIAVTRKTKRGGQVWIKIFPDHPVTKKPAETRMGKGKGSVDHYAARIYPGKILYELKDVPKELAVTALKLAASKMPLKTQIVALETDDWMIDNRRVSSKRDYTLSDDHKVVKNYLDKKYSHVAVASASDGLGSEGTSKKSSVNAKFTEGEEVSTKSSAKTKASKDKGAGSTSIKVKVQESKIEVTEKKEKEVTNRKGQKVSGSTSKKTSSKKATKSKKDD